MRHAEPQPMLRPGELATLDAMRRAADVETADVVQRTLESYLARSRSYRRRGGAR